VSRRHDPAIIEKVQGGEEIVVKRCAGEASKRRFPITLACLAPRRAEKAHAAKYAEWSKLLGSSQHSQRRSL
jgi:hypothetical protein